MTIKHMYSGCTAHQKDGTELHSAVCNTNGIYTDEQIHKHDNSLTDAEQEELMRQEITCPKCIAIITEAGWL